MSLSTSLFFSKTKRGKVNPLRSSHLTSGAAESLLFTAHPEGLSTNGIHMISISSGRQEPAFQRISFLLQRTQSRHQATAGKRKEGEKKGNTYLIIDQSGPIWKWNSTGPNVPPISSDVISNSSYQVGAKM